MKRQSVNIEWIASGVLKLPAVVNVETVPELLKLVDRAKQPLTTVDFSDVVQADSVALALLLKWQTASKQPIQVQHLPEDLQTLVHLYDLESVLQV